MGLGLRGLLGRAKRFVIVPILIATMSATACGSGGPPGDLNIARDDSVTVLRLALTDASAVPGVVAATWNAGAVMLELAPKSGNTVVSPSSLVVALSMLAEGARGETLTQIEAALGASGTQRQAAFAALRGALAEFEGDPAVVRARRLPNTPTVHFASQVVVDDALVVNPEFLTTLAEVYDAGVQYVDLGSAEGKAALDSWVRYHSGGLVEESAIEPSPDLRLVLQDAIVFASRWDKEFETRDTADRDFWLTPDQAVRVPMMNQTAFFYTAEVDGWRAVRVPYQGGAFHADFLLPPVGVDPASASVELLGRISQALDDVGGWANVSISIPLLEARPDQPLALLEIIDALGMGDVLSPALADLTGLGHDAAGFNLYLGQAAQQAVLIVDEAGTRAAAVTELGVMAFGMPAPPWDFWLDRPFAMQIVHSESGWPLFLAAIRDPRL